MAIGPLRPIALAMLLVACRAEADPVDTAVPDGPVVDEADMLAAADEDRLDARLRAYWEEERTAIVVNTIDNLEGRSIEAFATERFTTWGIGDGETDRGVLILLARDDRMARIEVGCGLETVLTNAVAQRILDDDMIPPFRSANFIGGIEAAVDEMEEALATASVPPGPVSPICLASAQ